jgi:hypothetical protein
VITCVDIFDVPSECGCRVADQEGREVTHVLDAHKAMLRRAGPCSLQKLVEALNAGFETQNS